MPTLHLNPALPAKASRTLSLRYGGERPIEVSPHTKYTLPLMTSPFQQIQEADWVAANDVAFAIRDGFPVTPGHTLVMTRRVVPTWFEASADEQMGLMQLVNDVKLQLDKELTPKPDGYNVGFNSGDAAGQTVQHVHIHVIPRRKGDMADPRGGVRHVIPERGNYLIDASTETKEDSAEHKLELSAGHPDSPLWDHLSWRIAGARTVDVLVSFVQRSGLDVIENRLFDAIRNDASVRILVSDYLYISDVRALRRLLGWMVSAADEFEDVRLSVKLVELHRLPSEPQSFHPKAWQILDDRGGFIAVGSSNLSAPALQTGVEWNLLSTQSVPSSAHQQVAAEFASLWDVASPLTPVLIDDYAKHATESRQQHFQPETHDSRDELFEPRPWQVEALESLNRIRAAGYQRALVAVATGMGKTWLAAFDIRQVGQQLERRPRVLVIAHRAHILAQAEAAISRVLDAQFDEGTTAWYLGSSGELCGDLVIASVQKLSRPEGLNQIAEETFDYVVMDEVHHAHSPSYRRVLSQLRSNFILGLTATPERSDGYDVATIFDDNLAYHATIGDGISDESLVPFHYVGIKDTVDFHQIPWRNGRFDIAELEKHVAQSERMQRLALAMKEHPASRTIVFCCSQRHAVFVRDWLRERNATSAAVFSGDRSDSYAESLNGLRSGQLQYLCVVDMFNEGLDIPAVDRVIMLRPTESKVIFLQQLGRGLRASEGKTHLLVMDFVGNHRVFAQRMIHLLSLRSTAAGWKDLKKWLNGEPPDLPEGCLLDVELDAKDVLKQFLPKGKQAGVEGYGALRDELGRRPQMIEFYNRGYLPKTVTVAEGSWFAFVDNEHDLQENEGSVASDFADWLKVVESTQLNKSYKMVVLRVLLDQGALFTGVKLTAFSAACRRFMQNHDVLRHDLSGQKHAVDHEAASDSEWARWWVKWPISKWLDKQGSRKWFVREGDTFRLGVDCAVAKQPILEALTEELVEYRLAHYAKSRRLVEPEAGEKIFEAKVSHSSGRAILFVPEKSKCPHRPIGLTSVHLPDGSQWDFKFVKVACNVAMPAGKKANQLSELLRKWFGQNAGLPGTNFTVRFETKNDEWQATPTSVTSSSVDTVEPAPDNTTDRIVSSVKRSQQFTTHVPVYDVSAAAGDWGPEGVPEAIGWINVPDQNLAKGMFAAQVIGHSMEPKIASGSWCLFRPCPAGSREGRLLLVQCNTHLDPEDGGRYTVKQYHSVKSKLEEGWQHGSIELQPLNPDYKVIHVTPEHSESMRVVGEFVSTVESFRADL
ncbi:MAG: DEAD/DEAH box helicase family protein [Fuerstiella sp.]|nr:DEAD/DEAH box helicase family protein [Fuerstiella sp.]